MWQSLEEKIEEAKEIKCRTKKRHKNKISNESPRAGIHTKIVDAPGLAGKVVDDSYEPN